MHYLYWLYLKLAFEIKWLFHIPLANLRRALAVLVFPINSSLSLSLRTRAYICTRSGMLSMYNCNTPMAYLINTIYEKHRLDIKLGDADCKLNLIRDQLLSDFSLFCQYWDMLHSNEVLPIVDQFYTAGEISQEEHKALHYRKHEVYSATVAKLITAEEVGMLKGPKFAKHNSIDLSKLI